jgi:5'-methylthioadenosine phosphorylase
MTNPVGVITSKVTPRLIKQQEVIIVQTPFGTAAVIAGYIGSKRVFCINRYGDDQSIPTQKINFKANIWAFRELGVQRVISQNAIGSVNPALHPGDIVIPNDIIDHTKQRVLSLFDETDCWVRVDMTEPFCPEMRNTVIIEGNKLTNKIVPLGVFVCVEGPRFETPAEIRLYHREGGDIIGTPVIPEAVLAREAELCFASIAPIINYGAGISSRVIHSGPDGMVIKYYDSGLHDLVEGIIEKT